MGRFIRMADRIASSTLRAVLGATALAAVVACAVGALAGPLPAGVWVGPQANMTVYPDSASVELGCAVGRVPSAIVAGGDGTFTVPGLYAIAAGPVPVTGPRWQDASFQGTRSGDDLTLTIVLSTSGAAIGPFQLHRGTIGQFPLCL